MDREEWDRRYDGEELLWRAEPNRFLVEATSDLKAGTVLDIACGEGRNAIWLAELGWKATGVDFSAVALDKARRFAETRGVDVHWIEGDVLEWRPAMLFDLVAVLYLQLPAHQRRQAYRAAADAVAPGGHLVVIGHDVENLTSGVGGPQHPDVLFTAADVAEDIDGSSLAVERAEQVRRPVVTDEGERDARDVLFRAVRAL